MFQAFMLEKKILFIILHNYAFQETATIIFASCNCFKFIYEAKVV